MQEEILATVQRGEILKSMRKGLSSKGWGPCSLEDKLAQTPLRTVSAERKDRSSRKESVYVHEPTLTIARGNR